MSSLNTKQYPNLSNYTIEKIFLNIFFVCSWDLLALYELKTYN